MHIKRVGSLRRTAAVALAAIAASTVVAQEYPDKPVRLVVPTAPGGGFDILGRHTAQRLGEMLKQSFVVENKVGAGTLAGTEFVARSAPDGYTLLMGGVSNMALNPGLFRKLPYDPVRDFVPAGFLATYPVVLVARKDHPAESFADFVKLAREQPGRHSYASAGVGTGQHVWCALLLAGLKLDVVHVPFKGAAPAHQDLLGGRVDTMLDNISAIRPHIEAGRVKALGVSSRQRAPQLPNVPTLMESGLTDFEAGSWMGIFAPAGTPPAVVEKLRAQIGVLTRSADFVARIERDGGQVLSPPPAEQQQLMVSEVERWTRLIRQHGVTVD